MNAALAETVSLHPSADTTLLEYYPSNNFGGNEYFNAGTTQNFATNRALIKFDVAGNVPRGSRILSASLTVDVVHEPDADSTPSNFALHRLLRDWGEGNKSGHPAQQTFLGQPATVKEATWFYRFAFTGELWAAPGGAPGVDFAANSSGETYIYGTAFSPYLFDSTPALVGDVQLWLNQPGTNFGWLLLTQDEQTDFTARRFASREDINRAPVLTLEYSSPRIDAITTENGQATLRFHAEPGTPTVILFADSPTATNWQTLINIEVAAAAELSLVTPATAAQRFYRLWVP